MTSAAPWMAVEIELPDTLEDRYLDILSGALFEAGVGGIENRDSDRPRKLIATFPPEVDDVEVRARGALAAADFEPLSLVLRPVEPIDWATHWQQHFQPLDFGRVWIVPPWLEAPADAECVLRLDPGMAFGTGQHETTALCLERIAELSPIESVLDVGTGTGILALAALLLGAVRVVGTDNDPEALRVAAETAEQNALELELSPAEPDTFGTFALVVANILAEPLIELAPRLARAVAPGGRLILSGLLTRQAERVAAAYAELGLSEPRLAERGEWARLEFSRA